MYKKFLLEVFYPSNLLEIFFVRESGARIVRAESRADNLFTADQKICVLFVAACDLIAYNLTENVNVPEGNTVYYLTLINDVCKFVFCYGFRQYDFS